MKKKDILKGIHQHIDLSNLADFLTEAIHQLLSCPLALLLIDPQRKGFIVQSEKGLYISGNKIPGKEGAIVRWFISTGNNLLIKEDIPAKRLLLDETSTYRGDTKENGKDTKEDEKAVLQELENLNAQLCLALKSDDAEIIGLLSIGKKNNNDNYSKIELRTLEEIAEHAAYAIDKIRIYTNMIEECIYANLGKIALQIAHDLNGPLNNINVFLQLLAQDCEWRQAVRTELIERLFTISQKETNRAIAIIKDLLVYGQPVRPKTESIGLHQLLDQVLEICTEQLHKNGILVLRQYHYNEIFIPGEPDHLTRIFINLIRNAIEAMEGEEKRELSVRTEKEDHLVRIVIQDTGKGIPEGIKADLFKPFVTSGKRKGLGLGLSIIKRFINLHGGRIDVADRDGKGTSFAISLPSEKRETHRQLAASVEIYRIPQNEVLVAQDLSATGLRLSCQKYISENQLMKLFIKLPDNSSPIPILGRVVWIKEIHGRNNLPYDIGLEFIDIGKENQEHIKKWTEK